MSCFIGEYLWSLFLWMATICDLLTRIIMQVPAKPNYNLVMYYAAERPVNKDSLLGRFIDGTDAFRDARFKLIPSIVEV